MLALADGWEEILRGFLRRLPISESLTTVLHQREFRRAAKGGMYFTASGNHVSILRTGQCK